MPASLDEAAIKRDAASSGQTASQAAMRLADAKAAHIHDGLNDPDAIVIGCDQILVCDGTWFDKPPDLAAARAQLHALRGRRHTLATATVCLQGGQIAWRHEASPALSMRHFSDAFLDAYIAAEGEALLGSVGAYRLEGLGIHLFDAIEGEHSAILGLPLPPLLAYLRAQGVLTA